jgi:hypothetical protein
MRLKNILSAFMIIGCLALIGHQAYAQNGILPPATGENSIDSCKNPTTKAYDADYCGDYALNDFISLAINVSKWILGIVGSLSLVMFIYGGFMFLISGGSADTIGQAKKILIAAVIGLVIVFSSYLIIKFVLGTMGLNWNGSKNIPKVAGAISQLLS